VRCRPGCTLFTVMPSPATSRASVFRNAVAPARAVFDRISWAIGWRTDSDVIATTRPHRCACIAGTAALHIATTDIRFRSSAAGIGVDGRLCEVATRRSTGVRHEDVETAERLERRDEAAAPLRCRRRRPRAAPRSARSAARVVDPAAVPTADRDGGPFVGERLRAREAQACRRRRHRRPPSVDPEVHGVTVHSKRRRTRR
jgi:hypothetical protein